MRGDVMDSTKRITAYYCSWCFLSKASGEKDHACVSIQYEDDSWEEIWRKDIPRDVYDPDRLSDSARVILEHFLGYPVSAGQVSELVNRPGFTLRRIEPKELERFKQGLLF